MIAVLRIAAALSGTSVLAGCGAFGFRSTVSVRNPDYFAAPPEIVRRDDGYHVVWTQGSWPFYFLIDSKPIDGRLVLRWYASSSSGHRAGKPHELPIRGPQRITALESGGAFWWEPDGSYVPLVIRDERTRPDS